MCPYSLLADYKLTNLVHDGSAACSSSDVIDVVMCTDITSLKASSSTCSGHPLYSGRFALFFKTVLSSGYILILLSIEYILASLIETCQG